VHPWITRALEKAQEKVETMHFDIRKNLLKYDNVMNEQRKAIYGRRKEVLYAENLDDFIAGLVANVCEGIAAKNIPEHTDKVDWDWDNLAREASEYLNINFDMKLKDKVEQDKEIYDYLVAETTKQLQKIADIFSRENSKVDDGLLMLQKAMYLKRLDYHWKEHLLSLEYLRGGIGLRAYGQKDPLNEYKKESFVLFSQMLKNTEQDYVQILTNPMLNTPMSEMTQMNMKKFDDNIETQTTEQDNMFGGVGRNDLCPCGSGKKYKHCHGKL
jgi:preprotein translocase subunit SecA